MTRAGIEPAAAAPSQPTRLDVRRVGWLGAAAAGSIPALVTFFSFSSPFFFSFSPLFQNLYFSSLHKTISILALFSCLSPFSSAGSSWLLSLSRFFPFFLPLTNPHRPCQSKPLLKARHEAVSFEAAEWSERLTSRRVGWLGAAAAGSIPALVTFFSFSSPFFFSFSPLFQNLYFSSLHKTISILALFSCLSPFSSAGSSWLLSLSRFFPFFLPLTNPHRPCQSKPLLKARHEAVSFEAAEWSERLTSRRVGWLGAAAAGSIPALVTFFSFSSPFFFSFSPLFQNLYFSSLHKTISILALFSCLSPFSSAGSSWLLSLSRFFPFFLPLTNPHRPCQSKPLLKARHEAVSFEAAEWSERLSSRRVGWLGAAAAGSIPALVTFFSFSSPFFFSFSPLFQNLYFSSLPKTISILALFSCLSPFSSAGSSWLLSLSRFFPFFLPLTNPHRPCQSKPLP